MPNFIPRMLAHLPYTTPIFDVIIKLINTDDTHPQLHIIDWLHEADLIAQSIELLNPELETIEAHAPACDLLRGCVAAASAASAAKQQQQQQFQQSQHLNAAGQPVQEFHHDPWLTWPNMALVRDLASQRSIDRLLHFMLDASRPASILSRSSALLAPVEDEEPVTPIATSFTFPQARPSQASATSSLLHCLTLLIDIIRKNNSDFTELQIMQYLERMGANLDDFSDDEDDVGGEGEGEEGLHGTQQYGNGPSVVELGPLLVSVTRRLTDIQALLAKPRSDVSVLRRVVGECTDLDADNTSVDDAAGHRTTGTSDFRTISNMRTLRRVAALFQYGYAQPTSE